MIYLSLTSENASRSSCILLLASSNISLPSLSSFTISLPSLSSSNISLSSLSKSTTAARLSFYNKVIKVPRGRLQHGVLP